MIAGGASFHMAEGIAQLAGSATAPAHRRRGVQSALLAARLADGSAAGCDIAAIFSATASASSISLSAGTSNGCNPTKAAPSAEPCTKPYRHGQRDLVL